MFSSGRHNSIDVGFVVNKQFNRKILFQDRGQGRCAPFTKK